MTVPPAKSMPKFMPVKMNSSDRDDREDGRERIAHAAEPHEREFGVLRGEAQELHGVLTLRSAGCVGRAK